MTQTQNSTVPASVVEGGAAVSTRHTPGPWMIPNGGMRPAVYSEGDLLIATLADTGNEFEANAALIAAAPDLLVALQTIALHASSLDVQGIRELCEAAIARATQVPA